MIRATLRTVVRRVGAAAGWRLRFRLRSYVAAVVAWMLAGAAGMAHGAARDRPDILVILADDLGVSDLGYTGGDLVETPHIDRLARTSVRFAAAYAAPVCSPSRAMLLTGRHPARLRMTIWSEGARGGPTHRPLLQAESRADLPLSERTLAEVLREGGYRTALVGKWHLGDAAHAPETQGFLVNIGGTHWGAPPTYFWPYIGNGGGRYGAEIRYVPGLGEGRPGEYLTDRLTDEAVRLLGQRRDQPLFLMVAHHAPHSPLEAKPGDLTHFQRRLTPSHRLRNPTYAAMVRSLDDSVGRLMEALRRSGREKNTLVVFASDNGGFLGIHRPPGPGPVPPDSGEDRRRNHPYRAGKGWCYEGGIRVPMLVRWPGITPARGADSVEPVTLADLFPTLAAAAGTSIPVAAGGPGPVETDGVDLRPVLASPGISLGREAIYFHYPHYYDASTPVSAVRTGPWKLLEFLEDERVELYRLDRDPGEAEDLSAAHPDRVTELRERLHAWRRSVGAAMPVRNPAWAGTSPAR